MLKMLIYYVIYLIPLFTVLVDKLIQVWLRSLINEIQIVNKTALESCDDTIVSFALLSVPQS